MPKPTGDPTTGWWSIRLKRPDGSRKKEMLARQPGWKPGAKMPKRPPAHIEELARKYQEMDSRVRHGLEESPAKLDRIADFLAAHHQRSVNSLKPLTLSKRVTVGQIFLRFCAGRKATTVQAVTVGLVEDFYAARLACGAMRSTVLSDRGALSPAWSQAVRAGKLKLNPWKAAVVPGRPPKGTVVFWTEEELGRLAAECRGWVRDFVLLTANCGGRVASVLSLRWRDVQFARGVIVLDSKTGKYEVPLSRVARSTLEARKSSDPNALVFPSPRGDGAPFTGGTTFRAIRDAARRAELPDKGHWNHILRHTFASHAVTRGVPLAVVSKWLGHTNITQTMQYSHLCPDESQRLMGEFSLGSGDLEATSRRRAG